MKTLSKCALGETGAQGLPIEDAGRKNLNLAAMRERQPIARAGQRLRRRAGDDDLGHVDHLPDTV